MAVAARPRSSAIRPGVPGTRRVWRGLEGADVRRVNGSFEATTGFVFSEVVKWQGKYRV